MYQTHKTYVRPDMEMLDLINENNNLLLSLQHFNIDYSVNNKTAAQICLQYGIDLPAFLVIMNLYNGFPPEQEELDAIEDIRSVLLFLKNSHTFYKEDSYPELKRYLKQLTNGRKSKDIRLIEGFLNDYFKEVFEHLEYEDEVAFPYFYSLMEGMSQSSQEYKFSVKDYTDNHTDIETKLSDLKSLLLKHLSISSDLAIKRKFLNCLFELEYDLKIHSIIEEKILIPKFSVIETNQSSFQ